MGKFGGTLGCVISWSAFTGYYDDRVNRLNHVVTVLILVLFAICVTVHQLLWNAVDCWTSAEFGPAWMTYTKSVCWVSNMYRLPRNESVGIDTRSRHTAELKYYQWIPIILVVMAVLFKLPNIVSQWFNKRSDFDLDEVVDLAKSMAVGYREDHDRAIQHIAQHIDRWLESLRDHKWNMIVRIRHRLSKVFLCAKRDGTYLSGYFLVTKLLYLVNAIGQLVILKRILAIDLTASDVSDLFSNGRVKESPQFPRVALCDFEIRRPRNVTYYTVQCVLPLNLFSEKIFVFLWFWMVVISAITAVSLLVCLWRILIPKNQFRFVIKYLRKLNVVSTSSGADRELARKFTYQYLRNDGVFALR